MSFSSVKARASFQAKVLAPVVTVMVLLVASTIWLINHRISRQLNEQAAEQLATAGNIFEKSQEYRTNSLLLRYRGGNNDSRFKSLVQTGTQVLSEPQARPNDLRDAVKTATIFLEGLIRGPGTTIAICTLAGETNRLFASANHDPLLDTNAFQAQSAAVINQALDGQPVVDTISVGSNILDVVSIPISVDDQIVGVLTFGAKIGPAEAREIKQLTHSEIVLLTDGRVVASSLPNPESHPELVACFNQLSAHPAAPNRTTAPEIMLNNEHFVCRPGHFRSLSEDNKIGYLLLSSYQGSYLGLQRTQQLLFFAGVIGIALGTAVVWFLIRQATRPLRQLRDSAEAVGRGDFSKRVEVNSQDECGELAVVFNQMTENVQASRSELEKTVETLKTTQTQLIQSEKLSGIGEFVAGVAHELNNPLTSVMGFAELLQQMDMPEQSRRYLDMIAKSAKRCQKVVSSLLSFARRHAPERKVVSLNEIVESAVEILNYQMRTSNIEVTTQLDPHLPATEVDPHQMQQVFLNIINNARQAMEGRDFKGILRITTESSDDRVRVAFQDNGPGIPEENLKKIFNPFFTTKEVGKGTGLGLSLCYGIVSEHGGTIAPYSADGEGATFVIELPVKHAATIEALKKASVPLPPATPREGVGKRVLVIDDEDTILQMIREALMRNGYRVDVAHDGESALRRLNQYHYDLALCDWKMPGLNGQQIFERLHESNPEMSQRIIFITGDIVNEKTQEFLRERGKVCLSKPFTLGEFRSAINRVMATGKG